MDAPRIRYAKTEDGVSIAYWMLGRGPVLLVVTHRLQSHIRTEWDLPMHRAAYERLAQRSTVVRYDARGVGLSQRGPIDQSLDARLTDICAVQDAIGVETAAVLSVSRSTPVAAFAARHPHRTSHVVFTVPGIWRGPAGNALLDAIRPVADIDWKTFAQMMAGLMAGWESPEAHELAALIRETHTPSSWRAIAADNDFSEQWLGQMTAPTLVLYRQGSELAEERAVSFTSLIKGSSMLAVPGEWLGRLPNSLGLDQILDFIGSADTEAGPTGVARGFDTGAFRTILFTDIEAHTAMMQRLGDLKGREVLREHERRTREALRAHGGTEVKAMGDGFMASFGSAQKALECAIALQRAFASTDCVGERLRVRVGINAGEPIAEEDDLFGSSVILASRTMDKAAGGEIFVTDVVRQLVAGKGFSFADRGEMEMKGFEEPVRLYEVRWQKTG